MGGRHLLAPHDGQRRPISCARGPADHRPGRCRPCRHSTGQGASRLGERDMGRMGARARPGEPTSADGALPRCAASWRAVPRPPCRERTDRSRRSGHGREPPTCFQAPCGAAPPAPGLRALATRPCRRSGRRTPSPNVESAWMVNHPPGNDGPDRRKCLDGQPSTGKPRSRPSKVPGWSTIHRETTAPAFAAGAGSRTTSSGRSWPPCGRVRDNRVGCGNGGRQ